MSSAFSSLLIKAERLAQQRDELSAQLTEKCQELQRLSAESATKDELIDGAFIAITNYLCYPDGKNAKQGLEYIANLIGPPEAREPASTRQEVG